jgi:hypothetical protein
MSAWLVSEHYLASATLQLNFQVAWKKIAVPELSQERKGLTR